MEDSERTIYCGNLSPKVTEEILYELFLQAAPLEKVKIPVDKDGRQATYAFITFKHTISVQYAVQLLNGTSLYQRKIVLKPRSGSQYSVLQESTPQYMHSITKVNDLNERILGGQMQISNFNKHLDISPVSRRDRNIYDRRNDKPYGQVYRNRNNRYDYDSRGIYSGSYYRRQIH